MSFRHRGLLPLIAFGLMAARSLFAEQETVEPVRIEYRAPLACPDAAWFQAEVRARTPRLRLAADAEPARSFVVELHPQGQLWAGSIRIRELSGTESVRDMQDPQCRQVASALALIAAVALDPHALSPTLPSSSASAPTVSSAPAASSPPPPASAPPLAPPAPPRWAATPAPPPDPRPAWQVAAGADVGIVGGVSPDASLAFGGHVQLLGPPWAAGRWSVRASVLQASSKRVPSESGAASFSWTVARLDACPGRWPHGGKWSLSVCALFEAGKLKGSGSDTVQPESHSLPWWAWGALADGDWVLFDHLVLGLQAGAHVPLQRHRFYFEPSPTVYRVPAVAGFGLLSVSGRFP